MMFRWRNGYRLRFLPRNRRFNSHQHDFTNGIIFYYYFCSPFTTTVYYYRYHLGGVNIAFLNNDIPIPILAVTLLQ